MKHPLPTRAFMEHVFDRAVQAARQSPCAKSKRGVVIFEHNCCVYAEGHNRPPAGFRCGEDAACREHCNKVCLHAEEDAISQARSARGLQMLHVKVDQEGEPCVSGPPSCWQCSRKILDSGLTHMWLVRAGRGEERVGVTAAEDQGLPFMHLYGDLFLVRYDAVHFHIETARTCGIPLYPEAKEVPL